MEHVDLHLQNVRIQLRSLYAPLIDAVRAHLPHHVQPPHGEQAPNVRTWPASETHITVEVHWLEGDGAGDAASSFFDAPQLARLGKRHRADDDRLVWTDTTRVKNLAFRFSLAANRLHVEAAYAYTPSREKRANKPYHRERQLYVLTRWLVYQPLSWYLEHFRGLQPLTASGLEFNGRALVVAGVGGTGKTTTSVAMLARGGRLLSENRVFIDAEHVYSCYEPLRLDDRAVDLLRGSALRLERTVLPSGAKSKHVYHVHRDDTVEVAPAGWVFMPRFSSPGFVRELDEDECVERLVAFNDLTSELDDSRRFTATLRMKWITPASQERRVETLRAFVRRARRYEMGIDPAHGIEPVLGAILQRVGGEQARP